jgi:erythromycin esterase-like protein
VIKFFFQLSVWRRLHASPTTHNNNDTHRRRRGTAEQRTRRRMTQGTAEAADEPGGGRWNIGTTDAMGLQQFQQGAAAGGRGGGCPSFTTTNPNC